MENEEKRVYLSINTLRKLNIRVFVDDKIAYEGEAEQAPADIGKLRYSKIENSDRVNLYVYSELQ